MAIASQQALLKAVYFLMLNGKNQALLQMFQKINLLEADAIIGSRSNKITQAFLETFNRYQRKNPARVVLATNSYSGMDSAIQSRGYIFNLANPSKELKYDIFVKKLNDLGMADAYSSLLGKRSKVEQLFSEHSLSGRDIESIAQKVQVIAEMRISQSHAEGEKDKSQDQLE